MAQAERDENFVPTLLGVSNADGETPVRVYADPTTHRLLVDLPGGAGTVTSVSVVTANGFAGSVADPTTTPAITLSTTVTGILQGNGTAISAITVGSGLNFAGGTLSATGVAGSIVVGTTTITSGTDTRILYDNAGVLGEYTITGTGTVVAMQTAPTFATSITTPSVLATANDSGALGASGTAFSDLFLASGGVINWSSGDITITHGTNDLTFGGSSGAANGFFFSNDVAPTANDGAALGKATTSWSDLFLAEGGVINWDNGDATLTQSGNSLTLAGANLVLAESVSVVLDSALSADGTYTGTTISGTAGAALAFGDAVYLAAADSRWELADASAASTSGSVMVGICVLAAASDGDPTVILLNGTVRADTAFPTFTVSAPVYISETAGDLTNTAPTTTDSVTRVMGTALDGNTLLLNISADYVTHV